jgi:hypothetical protein
MPIAHPAKLQSLVLLASIALTYVVLHIDGLKPYSLQIFAGSIAIFFILKRFKRAKLWHVLPDKMSLEVGLLTFAFTFLIGSTGNTHSVFYPLSYIHLFLLIFSASAFTSIGTIIFLMLFHYALEPVLTGDEVGAVLSLAVIGIILLFAKQQYDEVHSKEELLEKEVFELDQISFKEQTIESFIRTFLKPKISLITQLLEDPEETKATAAKQMALLETELEKMTTKLDGMNAAITTTPTEDK